MPMPKFGQLPRASSITQTNIEAAYIIGFDRQRRRIEEIGKLNRKVLKGIGKAAAKDGTVNVKKDPK